MTESVLWRDEEVTTNLLFYDMTKFDKILDAVGSDILETAGRKTRIRRTAIAKCYAFHANP